MKSLKNKLLILCLAAFSLSSGAAQAPQAQDQNILCQLFGITCPVVTADTGGRGKEPPQGTGE